MNDDLFSRVADHMSNDGSGLHRFHDDPSGFARECIRWPAGSALTDYQVEILTALTEHRRVAVRGPHGLGKTTIAAAAVLWFSVTREHAGIDWKVATTAGAWRQLTAFLWPEIRKWARRLDWSAIGMQPWSEREALLALTLKLHWGHAFAAASDNPALLEGTHADSVLYVFDEAKSIIPATFDAAEGAFSGGGSERLEAYALAMSTPGEPSGRFWEIHARKPGLEDWWTRHVALDEAIGAGRINRTWANQRAKQWGRKSSLYANRVLGEFHTSDSDGVIPLEWVESANERWRVWSDAGRPASEGVRTVGVDVARSGSDKTVMAVLDGDVVTELRASALADTMATTGTVAGILGATPGRLAVVDVIGVGAGVVDRLRELGQRVAGFNASEASSRVDRSGELGFVNARAAAWWHLRERLDPAFGATLALPPDDALTGDLVAPRWKVVSTGAGRLQIESKDEMRRRIGRSTDHGDAVVQAVWGAIGSGPTWVFDDAPATNVAVEPAGMFAVRRNPLLPNLDYAAGRDPLAGQGRPSPYV